MNTITSVSLRYLSCNTILIQIVTLLLFVPILGYLLGTLKTQLFRLLQKVIGHKPTFFLFNWFTFLGVWHHELSHALFAFVTGAKIKNITLFKPDGNSLGSVTYVPRGNFLLKHLQKVLTSIAPLITGCITVPLLVKYLITANLSPVMYGLLIYLVISIFLHMTMSSQDIKVMWKSYLLLVVGLTLVTILLSAMDHISYLDLVRNTEKQFLHGIFETVKELL